MGKINDFSQLRNLMGETDSPDAVSERKEKLTRSVNRNNNQKLKEEKQTPTQPESGKPESKKNASFSAKPEVLLLKRKLNVYCWNVKATIARSNQRDDLMPVLIRASENEGTFPQDIAGHLLGEEVGREVIGRRLLEICAGLGLLENRQEQKRSRYFLTEDGQKALESGRVMVPEEAAWTIWASDDPLLDYPILRVEPYSESSAYDEVHGGKKQETRKRNDNFEKLPGWLNALRGKVSRPSAVGKEEIRLDAIETRVEPVNHDSHLEIFWSPDTRSLIQEGRLSDSDVYSTPPAPSVSFDEVWQELLEHESLWDTWDQGASRLLVSFDQTCDSECEPMRRLLEFPRPKLAAYGFFNSACCRISIFPASEQDAQLWALWKLKQRINTYATETEYAAWCEQSIFPFEDYAKALSLPARSELAAQVWRERTNQETHTTWHLVAVEDWGI